MTDTAESFLNMSLGEMEKQPPSYELALAWAIDGLYCDGGCHKQWFLERIIEALGDDLACVVVSHGDWEDGIAP